MSAAECKEDSHLTVGFIAEYKPGQKFPTPSPGNGGKLLSTLSHYLLY